MICKHRLPSVARLVRSYISLKNASIATSDNQLINQYSKTIQHLMAATAEQDGQKLHHKQILESLAFYGHLAYSPSVSRDTSQLRTRLETDLVGLDSSLQKRISYFNSEELLTYLELTRNTARSQENNKLVVERFNNLLIAHFKDSSPGYTVNGNQFQVTLRTVETHSFARLVQMIFMLPLPLTDNLVDSMKPLIDEYLYKESKNMSLEDHVLVLSSLLNYMPPHNLHINFLQNTLPIAKISSCSTFVMVVDLVASLASLSEEGKSLNDEEAFNAVAQYLTNQIPYIADWTSPELASYIIGAAVSLSKCPYRMKEPVWNVLQEGFFHFYHTFGVLQKMLYFQSVLDTGFMPSSSESFQSLFEPIEQEILAKIGADKIEEAVSYLGVVKRLSGKSSEATILKVLSQLDFNLDGVDYTQLISKHTAMRLDDLISDDKTFKNIKKVHLQNMINSN